MQCLNVWDSYHFTWILSLWDFWLVMLIYYNFSTILLQLIGHLQHPQTFAISIWCKWWKFVLKLAINHSEGENNIYLEKSAGLVIYSNWIQKVPSFKHIYTKPCFKYLIWVTNTITELILIKVKLIYFCLTYIDAFSVYTKCFFYKRWSSLIDGHILPVYV